MKSTTRKKPITTKETAPKAVESSEVGEIYKDQRPTLFKQLIGQRHITSVLQSQLKQRQVQHTMLFTGPTGCGKTTTARILASKLNNGTPSRYDVYEMNCAGESRGIDTIRQMRENFRKRPLRPGGAKVFILDECHRLTPEAQDALLKMLEDTPVYVYVILCSSNPDKIIATLRGRAMPFKFESAALTELQELIEREAKRYGVKLREEEVMSISMAAQGSFRKALVILNGVRFTDSPAERRKLIETLDDSKEAVELARLLMKANGMGAWASIAKVLKALQKTDDPERVRWTVLSYFTAVALNQNGIKGPLMRCAWVLECFSTSVMQSGFSGLVTASIASLTK